MDGQERALEATLLRLRFVIFVIRLFVHTMMLTILLLGRTLTKFSES